MHTMGPVCRIVDHKSAATDVETICSALNVITSRNLCTPRLRNQPEKHRQQSTASKATIWHCSRTLQQLSLRHTRGLLLTCHAASLSSICQKKLLVYVPGALGVSGATLRHIHKAAATVSGQRPHHSATNLLNNS